ncbi:MFS transporter [Actinoplanes sp. NBRC 103695]|uniref:MFS transporter n=1 Tax=Actinoplanes sp. NBRC 103695 TaxID=3032202 RepID=UPI0024A57E2B|nr:MFS transporter [Actinoplanes sp. NBRC 103695]GLY97926.1 MFS transporter [Actinoplanes sp. NBRC 103695]
MRKWWPLVTVCLGTFMLLIDVTIVNVALPPMTSDLGSSFGSLQWVLDGYALALGVLLLGAGSLGDRVGHRRLYAGGPVVFALSSLACGLAGTDTVLIAARVVQGAGAAAMFTTTSALLNSAYQGRERGVAYGIWGGVSGAAAAIGPVLGGLLTDGLGWRWIFLVNLPISVVTIVLCRTVLRPGERHRTGRFDVAGLLAFTVFAAALTVALIRANEVGWSTPRTWGLLLLSAVALAVFVAWERRDPHPMLDLSLLRNRSFTGILIASLLVNFAAFASFTYTSVWLQSLIGLSPLEAGLTGLPMGLASVTTGLAASRLQSRYPRALMGGGMLLIGVGALLCAALLGAGSSWPALVPGFVAIGVGVGMALPVMASAGMATVPPRRGGMAAGALNTARQLGFAVGIAVLGAVFASRAAGRLADHGVPDPTAAAHALAAGRSGRILGAASDPASVSAALHDAAAAGLDGGFLIAGGAGLLGALAVLLLVTTREAPARDRSPSVSVPA